MIPAHREEYILQALRILVVLTLVGLLLAVGARPAHAATFTVNSTADTSDGTCDATSCTLREAINAANSSLGGADTIGFDIAGSGVHTIAVSSALPTITDPVTIDGYTQGDGTPGDPSDDATPNTLSQGNDAVLKVELNGAGAGSVSGLRISAGNSTVRGLVINRFKTTFLTEAAIKLETNGGNTIQGNFLGTDAAGNSALGNYYGVLVEGATSNTIGGTEARARNVISSNVRNVSITRAPNDTPATGNMIQGNYIGTNAAGAAALPGSAFGVLLDRVFINTVGGTTAGARNVISGNNTGVYITGFQANNNSVQGNYIGTDAAGTLDLGNSGSGVGIDNSPGNHIGGTDPGARNVISGNDFHGVSITGSQANSNFVRGNYIGTDVTGTLDRGNRSSGVDISHASNNTVGGTAAGAGNLISGNSNGVHVVHSDATGNVVQGNFIGTDAAGETALRNDADGVWIEISPNTRVGGTEAGARNVISGNAEDGVAIESGAAGTLVQGNRIGTDDDGESDLGNGRYGVFVNGNNTSQNNTIGGSASGAGNLISGNNANGVAMAGIGARNNVVQGNYIGTDAAGTAALGNGGDGVFIGNAPNNTIGGTLAGARNVISGNTGNSGGVHIQSVDATGNVVQGNYIGTDVTGTLDLGNRRSGVSIFDARLNTIGGTASGAGNLISGNGFNGISFSSTGSKENKVQGNRIGTAANGTDPLGNSFDGVRFIQDASDNTIGGTVAGAGNIIAHNADNGVAIFGDTSFPPNPAGHSQGNAILSNSIFSNGDLGIDLLTGGATSGVTANDLGDGDNGANRLQNFPVLTTFTTSGGTATIGGTLDSAANTLYTVQFFSNPAPDPSGHGEGKTYLGQKEVTTDATGHVDFTFDTSQDLTGQVVSATATDPSPNNNTAEFSRNTSEFSRAISPNAAPVANNDPYSTDEDALLTVAAPGVLGNDSDPESANLTATLVDDVDHGGLTLNANGSFEYAPNENFNGSDSFTYKATDGTATSSAATVSITVRSVNDAPAANGDEYTTNEDAALTVDASESPEGPAPGVLGNDTDIDDQALTVADADTSTPAIDPLSGPSQGTLTLDADGSFTYEPTANSNGTDSFTYKATDGTDTSNAATVTLTVNPVNDPVVAVDDSRVTREDDILSLPAHDLTANDSDEGQFGQGLTITAVGSPVNGTVHLSNGNVIFQPDADYSGPASFEYTVCDDATLQECDTAPVDVDVTPVDDPPTVSRIPDPTIEQGTDTGPLPFTVTDVDTDIADLTLSGSSDNQELVPDSGIVIEGSGENRTVTVTPTADKTGMTRIVLKASDGTTEGGNVFFLTVRDARAPEVRDWKPKGVNVSTGAKPTVIFSEKMDPSTLVTRPTDPANPNVGTSTTFTLRRGTTTIGATVQYVETETGQYKAILTPRRTLVGGVTYRATVTTAAEDTSGNALDQNKSLPENQPMTWKFTVR